jgi:hypothetical protein
MRYVLVAATSAIGLVAAGGVFNATRAETTAGDALITTFTVANVKQAIADAGGEFVETTKAINTGNEGIEFRHNGRSYYAWIDCYEVGCAGLELTAEFATGDVTISLETVNAYNLANVDGKALFDSMPPPQVRTARFLMAHGGISPKNVVFEIRNFFTRTDGFLEHLQKANVVASAGTATPVSAPAGTARRELPPRPHSKGAKTNTLTK